MTNLDILLDAKGIGPSALDKFENAGYESIEEVGMESPSDLSDKVRGVGYTTSISVLKHLEREGYREEKKNDEELEKLVELLQELFEFDTKDRDFGVYKLMNANREKIDKFIQEDLVNTIETEIEQIQNEFSGTSKSEARNEVLEELGTGEFFDENNNTSKKAKELIESKNDGVSENELENIRSDIYNHIYTFFSNYYNNGDFINRRKRSHHDEPYSVPYDGSNTNFHWVTKNQYYAKTSDQYMRFSFNHQNNSYKFNTINTEYDGSGIGNNEYFVMDNVSNIDISDNEITVNFYRRMIGDEDLERFNDLSTSTHNKQNKINKTFANELAVKLREENIPFEKEELRNKIDEYTTRNQNDFFIHKNLEKFLQLELEEYIKTEIVKFKPSKGIESLTDVSIEKARVINKVSTDIISFISQIEKFKRKLFEKKKFVTDSKQLIQLTEIPDKYYNEILNNQDQLDAWKESYRINVIELDKKDLKESPYNQMIVDTEYFDIDITTREEPKNKLIKGDNYQALSFLEEKYKNSVKCIYIDPPYNTSNAHFAYKDKYQRPTWLSMMYDRLKLANKLLTDDGAIFVSIDYNEFHRLKLLLESIFGEENFLTSFVWKRRSGANDAGNNISIDHEYVLAFSKSNKVNFKGKMKSFSTYANPDNDKRGDWAHTDLTGNDTIDENPDYYYSICDPETGEEYYPTEDRVWAYPKDSMKELIDNNLIVFPDKKDGMPTKKRFKKNMNKYKPISSWIEPNTIDEEKISMEENIREVTILSTGLNSSGTRNMKNIFGNKVYDYPKPKKMVKSILKQITDDDDMVLDFFSGSGTTGQAVQELNRERDKKINFILVEMLDKAFAITEERAKRIAFTNEWKDGEPQLNNNTNTNKLKFSAECIELESYEEALDAVKFDDKQSSLGDFKNTLLNYMLEFGTKDSPVFLDTDQLSKPKEYTLDGELNEKSVDVMTTFNYLIGLNSVKKETISIEGVSYTIYKGVKENDNICVIWRHNAGEANYKLEKEELELDDYDIIYINGDSILDNSIPISSEFKKQMLK